MARKKTCAFCERTTSYNFYRIEESLRKNWPVSNLLLNEERSRAGQKRVLTKKKIWSKPRRKQWYPKGKLYLSISRIFGKGLRGEKTARRNTEWRALEKRRAKYSISTPVLRLSD